jgi:hypothetical protein
MTFLAACRDRLRRSRLRVPVTHRQMMHRHCEQMHPGAGGRIGGQRPASPYLSAELIKRAAWLGIGF